MPERIKQNFAPSAAVGSMALERLATAWCRLMHDSAMWPVHGEYECRSCGRHYPVPWVEPKRRPRIIGTSMLVLHPMAADHK
jgi:hypothetical protein